MAYARAERFQRIIKMLDGKTVVPIGKKGIVGVTTVPTSMTEARKLIREWLTQKGASGGFKRGSGDEYILNNKCELHYYKNGKTLVVLRDETDAEARERV